MAQIDLAMPKGVLSHISSPNQAITRNQLLVPYLAIPLILMLVGLSAIFNWGLWIKQDPHDFFIFILFFNIPHIFASFATLLDKEYIVHYSRFLGLTILCILSLIAVFLQFNKEAMLLVLVAISSVYHVVRQQYGICKMLLGFKSWQLNFSWVLSFCVIAFNYYAFKATDFRVENIYLVYAVNFGGISLLAMVLPGPWGRSQTRFAKIYWVLTMLWIISAVFLFALQYYIFAIALLRIVHDITAFAYYRTHDLNRNRIQKHNLLYKILGLPRSVLLYGYILLFAILSLAYQVSELSHYAGSIAFIGILHYVIESRIWQQGQLHRVQIALRL